MTTLRLLFIHSIVAFVCLTATVSAQGWTTLTPITTKNINGLFSVSALQTIAVGETGAIIGTTNGGTNWLSAPSGTTQTLRKVIVAGFTVPVIWTVGDGGTLLRSTNGGYGWTPVSSGVVQDLLDIFAIDFTNGTILCIVGKSGTILRTTNSGTSWTPQVSPVAGHLNGVFFTTALIGYAVGDGGAIITTTDGGVTWASLSSGITADLNHLFFTTPTTGWIAGDGGAILATTDSGQSWSSQTSNVTADLRRLFFTDALNGTAVGRAGTIVRTTDAGVTWAQQNSATLFDLNSVFFTDMNTGMVVGDDGLVKKTTNGGFPVELEHFSAQVAPDGEVRLDWITASEIQNYGFYIERSTDAAWTSIGFVPGHGDSYARQAYTFTDRPQETGSPVHYRLRQIDYDGGEQLSPVLLVVLAQPLDPAISIAPNPCVGQAVIHATLTTDAPASLAVFDANGKRIATLFDGMPTAGTHIWTWLPVDAAPGVYYAVLHSGDAVRSATIILQ